MASLSAGGALTADTVDNDREDQTTLESVRAYDVFNAAGMPTEEPVHRTLIASAPPKARSSPRPVDVNRRPVRAGAHHAVTHRGSRSNERHMAYRIDLHTRQGRSGLHGWTWQQPI